MVINGDLGILVGLMGAFVFLFIVVFIISAIFNYCPECKGRKWNKVPFQRFYSEGRSKWDTGYKCEDCGYKYYPLE